MRTLAEYPHSFVPLGPGDERIDTGRYVLLLSAERRSGVIQRQRFPAHEVDDVLDEARSLLLTRGRTRAYWGIGSSAQPPHLVELLLQRGLVRDTDSYCSALVLRSEPMTYPAPSLVAGPVERFEDYCAAREVQWAAFGVAAEEIAEGRAMLGDRWKDPARTLMHATWLDREIVCAGECAATPHGLLLFRGATLPQARGRGAYRALIHARWREALANGTPTLVTQAGAMSSPILKRLGFSEVGTVEVLIDEFAELS